MNVPQHPEPPQLNTHAPLIVAAAAFACGIWLAGQLLRSPSQWSIASALLAACAMAAVANKNLRIAQASAVLALVGAGAFARVCTPIPSVVVPPAEFISGERVEVIGHVVNDGATLAGSGPRERFDLQTESMMLGELKFTQPVGIRATLFSSNRRAKSEDSVGSPQFPEMAYGDRVHFIAKLRPPRNFRNPGAFDYEGYLHSLGISTLASVSVDEIEILPGRAGGRLGFWRSRIRRSILEHINGQPTALWSREDAALFSAMIIGDDSLLLRNVREEFQQTGVYHLLVVSGMNVALLAFAVFWLARRLRTPQWAASVVTIALAVFYAYIAGMGVPIMRAVLMLSVYLLARLFYRGRQSLNATGFAALIVLVISPAALFEAGFQLTFLALVAIAGIGVPVLQRTSSPYRLALLHMDSTAYDLNLEPKLAQLRLDMRLIMERLGRFVGAAPARWLVLAVVSAGVAVFELIAVSAITQATLVAPMRAYFHRAAIIGMPANILVLPLAGVMLNSGVAAIALSYVWWPLARVAGFIAAAALHWTLGCLQWLAHFNISQWRVPDAGVVIFLVAATGILLALLAVRRQPQTATAGLALLFASAAVVAFYAPRPAIEPGKLEVTSIDVGQGDSLLVISPQGRTMLIDGGGSVGPVRSEFDFGEDVVSTYLWSRGIAHLDVVALTHAHGDHIGGLTRIVENFHPRELWVGINPQTDAVARLYQTALQNHAVIRIHTAGEELEWGSAQVRVLAPPADWRPKVRPANDDSLALLVSYGRTSALLAGDLENKMEKFVATEALHADLLKVAHHGSATSTTPELLAAVEPKFAVVSVGYRNSFGHPRADVLQRLEASHVRTYRTDLLGAVTFLLDGKQVQAKLASSY
ncbi:MAG: ComEC/Rec2 family competence protein [Acidobacteriia bacterium]|nr:ComEC/Rec2 family competence protein [Terriglobia bacterium]